MADKDPKTATRAGNESPVAGIPGSASSAHPTDGIPLPPHGFDRLDTVTGPDGPDVPAAETVTRAAVLLLGGAADRLGLSGAAEPSLDLPGAAALITALAGLLSASRADLGDRWSDLADGLRSLQGAYREASREPVAAGQGPGEALLSE